MPEFIAIDKPVTVSYQLVLKDSTPYKTVELNDILLYFTTGRVYLFSKSFKDPALINQNKLDEFNQKLDNFILEQRNCFQSEPEFIKKYNEIEKNFMKTEEQDLFLFKRNTDIISRSSINKVGNTGAISGAYKEIPPENSIEFGRDVSKSYQELDFKGFIDHLTRKNPGAKATALQLIAHNPIIKLRFAKDDDTSVSQIEKAFNPPQISRPITLRSEDDKKSVSQLENALKTPQISRPHAHVVHPLQRQRVCKAIQQALSILNNAAEECSSNSSIN